MRRDQHIITSSSIISRCRQLRQTLRKLLVVVCLQRNKSKCGCGHRYIVQQEILIMKLFNVVTSTFYVL